jgi:UDP-N-acetylmuramate--alanine ligase
MKLHRRCQAGLAIILSPYAGRDKSSHPDVTACHTSLVDQVVGMGQNRSMNLKDANIHFIGIGGIGMSGIAEVLLNMGCRVTGSDQSVNAQVERLQAMGVTINQGHKASNIPQVCHVVVYSSAVKPENPEVIEARSRHIPVVQRAEMLTELMRLKRGIAIAGSHGKTTTTSMTAAVMLASHIDPTIVVGGRLDLIKSTAALGKGDWLLAEADESDGSFLKLIPEIAVITNIDNDHLDHYKTLEALEAGFFDFASRIPFYGCAILCVDDPRLAHLAHRFTKRKITYGLDGEAQLAAHSRLIDGLKQSFEIEFEGRKLGRVELQVPGRHNVLNALAAIAVGLELKLDFQTIVRGLSSYRGVDRRLQIVGEKNQILVIDDYGHHPTEVTATLAALKDAYPKRRLMVAFQPHRYSRTQLCWDQFLTCFGDATELALVDIYPAGESPISGVTSEALAKALVSKGVKAQAVGPRAEVGAKLKSWLKPGDVLVTLGAGDIWKSGRELLS